MTDTSPAPREVQNAAVSVRSRGVCPPGRRRSLKGSANQSAAAAAAAAEAEAWWRRLASWQWRPEERRLRAEEAAGELLAVLGDLERVYGVPMERTRRAFLGVYAAGRALLAQLASARMLFGKVGLARVRSR